MRGYNMGFCMMYRHTVRNQLLRKDDKPKSMHYAKTY